MCIENPSSQAPALSTGPARKVMFTDLDGTLIDHDTYLPGPAEASLGDLTDRGVQVFFCSAKTLAEQEALAERLGRRVGYITENGALAVLPGGVGARRFGAAYDHVRRSIAAAAAESGVEATGYGDMTPAQIAEATGLDIGQAALAGERCCTETLTDLSDAGAERMGEALARRGLRLQRGARFWTVQGDHDKGTAVDWVVARLTSDSGPPITYAVGDGPNDAAMLRGVEHPMLVQGRDGEWERLGVAGLRLMDGIGPFGWVKAAEAVLGDDE